MRWTIYTLVGGTVAATVGTYLVLAILVCGVTEILVRRQGRPMSPGTAHATLPLAATHTNDHRKPFGALAWVAVKVGALSYGGGFVIVPLMQHDAVSTYHWLTSSRRDLAECHGIRNYPPVSQW